MNEKDLREIRRRFRQERHSISNIVGCFVNENRSIIAKFNQPIALGESETAEKLLSVMKRAISGTLGTNLCEVSFSTKQVLESEEHKLLSALRETRLKDDGALDKFYAKIIDTVSLGSNYVILLANDIYDVLTRHSDGEAGESGTVFSYIVCAVCPVKNVDEGLSFREADKLFHAISASSVVGAPELGIMFPAFTERQADIYHALYYTKSIAQNFPEVSECIFGSAPPMPPKLQAESFGDCLMDVLTDECSLEVVRSVHSQISDMLEAHKLSGAAEVPTVTQGTLQNVLECCGIDGERVEKFGEEFSEKFGKNAEVAPKNLVNTKKFELKTPDVVIKVNPDRRDLVTTETINGTEYILIKAEGGVEVNGVTIKID